MSNFLLYWKYFWDDIAENPNALNERWHTAQESFWHKTEPGDNLWVVVFGDLKSPDEWRLLQRIVVQEKFTDFSSERPYGIIGDAARSQRFDISSQSDLTLLLHKLDFISDKKIAATGRAIGNAIQTIRPLSEADGSLLEEYARNLGRHPSDVGFYEEPSESVNDDSPRERAQRGAGFGSVESNRMVEQAAIKFVTDLYESDGWEVESVEAEKCGYDLSCRKKSLENHVEVKGVQGSLVGFIITAGEVKQAKNDSNFVICVITSALTTEPKLNRFSGEQLIANFELLPLSYRAVLRQ